MKAKYAITALCIALLVICSFAYAMAKPLNHNEHMYISAALLAHHSTIYSDFAFLQMPYLPILYQMFYQFSATEYYLFWGRVWSWGVTMCAAVLLFALLEHRTKSWWVALAILPLFVLNQTILDVLAESSNYALSLAFSVVAFACAVHTLEGAPHARWLAAGGGLALACAIGTKLYYAVCFVPFGFVLLLYPRGEKLWRRVVDYLLPMLVGSVVGLLPAIVLLLRDPFAFWFNNVEFHTTNTLWRWSTGQTYAMTLAGKQEFFLLLLFAMPSNIIFFGVLLMGVIVVLELWQYGHHVLDHLAPGALLSLLLALTTTATLFFSTPMVIQHAAMAIPFVLLFLCGFSVPIVSTVGQKRHTLLLIVVLVVTIGAGGSTLLPLLPRFVQPSQWAGFALHRTAQELQHIVGGGGRVATLSPLYALEANMEIYPELASGPFLYRVGDMLSKEQQQRIVSTSPKSICRLLKQKPPDAILIGFEDEPQLEEPLRDCAMQMGYVLLSHKLEGVGMVYISPKAR